MFFSAAIRRIIFSVCICLPLYGTAQVPGIYLSANDFNKGKISYINTVDRKYKIKLNSVFYKPYLTIKTSDSKINYSKDSVFGYRDGSAVYRFCNKSNYTILNSGESILLYRYESMPPAKGAVSIVHYYFSKDAASPVVPLTITNLKNAFHENPAFQNLLDVYFRNDGELISYDNYNKVYKVNHLLIQSINTKS